MTFIEKIKSWFGEVFGTQTGTTEDPPVDIDPSGYKLPKLSDSGKRTAWVPWAVKSPGGRVMATHGTFEGGYPRGLVVHFTDGYSATDQAALNTLDGGISDGYTYLVLARDGTLYQCFPLSSWGYHAGESSFPGLGTSLNNKTVGVECTGMGQVTKRSDGMWGSKEQPAMHEYWNDGDVRTVKAEANRNAGTYLKFTEAQEKGLVELILWLAVNSGQGIQFINYVVGHDEIAPDRRDDPGGSLSMTTPQFRVLLKGLYNKIT